MAQHASVARVLKDFDESRIYHDTFVNKVEERYKAWRGVLQRRSEAAQWTSKLHPPYVLHQVETMVAALIDDRFRFRVNPSPRMVDAQTVEALREGAQAHEILLRHQLRIDHFHEKQRAFILQNCIAGLTIGKTSWAYAEGTRKRNGPVPMEDEYGPVPGPDGQPLTILGGVDERHISHDDPTFEVRDVRDWFWPSSAVSLERAPWIVDRCWYTFDELKQLEKAGIYKNVEPLRNFSDTGTGDLRNQDREDQLFHTNRKKGLIEVLEYWSQADKRLICVAGRQEVLKDGEWPYWHGEYPFVVCSSTPDLFRIPGVSVVERIAHIQEMLWTLMNQRVDNLQLINNAIVMFSTDVDPDDFEFGPGEKWQVEHPDQVKLWTPDPTSAQISLSAEGLLKGDLQNLSGSGSVFAGGADSGVIDQQTATGVSILSSIGQRLVASAKQEISNAYQRVGEQWMELNQQYVTEPRLVQVVGEDGVAAMKQISPDVLSGDFVFELEPATESMMRQERRAEAQALMQLSNASAPVMAAVGTPLNLRAFMDRVLDAYDIVDKERYYASQPQMLQGGAPGQQANPMDPQAGPGGVTAPQSIDPATSPSNQSSISPEVFMQRAQASGGGGARNI